MSTRKNAKDPTLGEKAAEAKKRRTPTSGGASGKKSKKGVLEAKHSPAYTLFLQLLPFIFYVSALVVLLVLILSDAGVVVEFVRKFLFGMFSISAFTIPVLLVLLGVFWRSGKGGRRIGWRFWCSAVVILIFSVLMHIVLSEGPTFSVKELYEYGIEFKSGGVIGGLIGSLFVTCFGNIISIVILGAVMFVLCLLLFGLTPNAVYHMMKDRAVDARDKRRERRELEAEAYAGRNRPHDRAYGGTDWSCHSACCCASERALR